MKKYLAAILSVALVFSLTACGGEQKGSSGDTFPEQSAEVYAIPMEYGRLYLQGADGAEDPVLTADSFCYTYSHRGDEIVAAFEDNTLRRFDLRDGSSEILAEDLQSGVSELKHYCNGGFVYADYDMANGTGIYRWYNGEVRQLSENSYHGSRLYVTDGTLLYQDYDGETDMTYLVALDINKETERWRTAAECDYFAFVYQQDDTVYTVCDNRQLCRVEIKDGTMVPVETSFDVNRFDILYVGENGSFLLNDRGDMSGKAGVYYADADGIRLLDGIPTDGDHSYAEALDHVGDKVLIRSFTTEQSPTMSSEENEVRYNHYFYHVVDMASGENCAEFTPESEITRMFKNGDFPVMDSSTARKPVTKDVYTLFCNSGAIPGSLPVCNTTHGAWLAIADRTSDVALLAAPTQEELEYLDEKGVEAEMKLYGGDGLVFIGNKACGVTDVTLEQVKAIYRGEITNWSELGGVDAPIRVLYRDDQSGSQRLFERMVWADEEIPDFEALGFEQLTEMNTIVKVCLYDPYSFGYSIMTYLNDVYDEEELQAFSLNGVTAEPEHVADGTYALSTKGYVVIRAEETQDSPARRLYNWFGSPVCNEILTNNGITPIHD